MRVKLPYDGRKGRARLLSQAGLREVLSRGFTGMKSHHSPFVEFQYESYEIGVHCFHKTPARRQSSGLLGIPSCVLRWFGFGVQGNPASPWWNI